MVSSIGCVVSVKTSPPLLSACAALWTGSVALVYRSQGPCYHITRLETLTLVLRPRHELQIFLGLPRGFDGMPSALAPSGCVALEAVPASTALGAASSTGSGRISSSKDCRLCILKSLSAVIAEAGAWSNAGGFALFFFFGRSSPSLDDLGFNRSEKLHRISSVNNSHVSLEHRDSFANPSRQ